MKTQEAIDKGHIKPWAGWESGKAPPPAEPWWNPQYGTPFAVRIQPWLNFLGVPCNAPPWGTLTAIDLVTKKIVWTRPMGTTRDLGPFGLNVNLPLPTRSEEHTSELQSLMRISYAVFCLKKKKH